MKLIRILPSDVALNYEKRFYLSKEKINEEILMAHPVTNSGRMDDVTICDVTYGLRPPCNTRGRSSVKPLVLPGNLESFRFINHSYRNGWPKSFC